MPFPPGSAGAKLYPNGFVCLDPKTGTNTECLLNAVWTWGDNHPRNYPDDPHPGQTATVQAVEQLTGLNIDDTLVMNLSGFRSLVDAVGGVDVTVTQRLTIGGDDQRPVASGRLTPGRHHLDGNQALWFARSRWKTDDYDRMARQRCLITALVRRVEAGTVADRLPQLLRALRSDIVTSISLEDLDRWSALGEKVRAGRMTTLVFDDRIIDTVRPDVPTMRALVEAALEDTADPDAGKPDASGRVVDRRIVVKTNAGRRVLVESDVSQDVTAACRG